jgi:hypothetical protein
MPQPDDPSHLNLTGTWHGLYSYPSNKKPVSFIAMVSELDGMFDGTTEETGSAGDATGQRLTASVQGRRTGRSLTMLKIYHGAHALYDSVQYAGELNEDGSEISGTWRVPESWSGTFLMIRSRTVATAIAKETAEQRR